MTGNPKTIIHHIDHNTRTDTHSHVLLLLGQRLKSFEYFLLRLGKRFAVIGDVGGVHTTSTQDELDSHSPHQGTSPAITILPLAKKTPKQNTVVSLKCEKMSTNILGIFRV